MNMNVKQQVKDNQHKQMSYMYTYIICMYTHANIHMCTHISIAVQIWQDPGDGKLEVVTLRCAEKPEVTDLWLFGLRLLM